MFRRFALVILNPIVGLFVDKSLNWTLIGLGVVPILALRARYKWSKMIIC